MPLPDYFLFHHPEGMTLAGRRKNRLPQSKLDAARRILGTKTETETIERALDLMAFGERLARGTEEARGLGWVMRNGAT